MPAGHREERFRCMQLAFVWYHGGDQQTSSIRVTAPRASNYIRIYFYTPSRRTYALGRQSLILMRCVQYTVIPERALL
jgi:hypothetical protein